MNATSRMMEPPVREGMMGAPPLVRRGPAADRDAALVERLRRHEEGAAEALVAEYGNRAYRLAMRITNNSSDAEEVVQDALWAASRKIETFRGTAAFGSWVYRITANAAYQKRRARRYDRNETSWEDLASTFDETGRPVQAGTDWSPRLQDPALQAELQAVLRSAIDELPGEHRATFLLRDVLGPSDALERSELGELLDLRLGLAPEEQLGRHRPRRHRVDRDLVAAQLVGEHADQALHARLRGDVGAVAGQRLGDDAARERDDTAAACDVPGRLAQHEEGAAQIGGDHPVEVLQRAVRDRVERHDAGAVHHHVDPPEGLERVAEEVVHVGSARHVRRDRDRAAVRGLDLAHQLPGPRRVAGVGRHHREAIAGQSQGHRAADAARSSGHHRHLA